jgi:hypothetical protein
MTTSVKPRKPAAKTTRPAAKPPAVKKIAKKAAVKAPVKQAAAKPKKPVAKPKKAEVASTELKVVRDGFTMPQADYDKIKSLKARCLKNGVEVKKSQLLRAGLNALEVLAVPDLLKRIAALTPVKAGRKKKKA